MGVAVAVADLPVPRRGRTLDTTGASIVMLPDTCTLGHGWKEVTADVSSMAGHQVTLTFIDHDDDDPSTPTHTLFDDVLWNK